MSPEAVSGLSRTGARVERLPLARYTTLGVGGESEVWFVSTHEQLAEAMEQPYRILGGGSNLVIADGGVPERVLRLSGREEEAEGEGGYDPGHAPNIGRRRPRARGAPAPQRASASSPATSTWASRWSASPSSTVSTRAS